ncbi:hypothetical protein TH53_16045 [Pedobacter lusitanus]|uniref:Uncharacterized protein n=1 Tax=Pedobacter lusitanus TaxID=1503925 RepID=A0A0D0GNY9_9SPHI|nr:hypothetical protein TH53_16045 [Pedobacter lusitanus]
MVELADAPPCLGGGEYGKPVKANYSLKVRLLPLQPKNVVLYLMLGGEIGRHTFLSRWWGSWDKHSLWVDHKLIF